MLTNGNDVAYVSSEESDEILSPGFLPESSLMPSRDEMELGIDLGRRLARLELGNEETKEQLDKINQKNGTIEEEMNLENSKVADMEGKVVSLEARLLSVKKQGFDANEKITKLEENIKKKTDEISALKKMLVKHKDQEEKFAKLERDSCELTSQFVKLLDICETLSDELESIKKINSDLSKNLKEDTTASKDSTPTSEDQTRKIKIDSDKNQQTTFYDHGGYNLNYYYSASTVDQDPAPGPIYLPHTSKAAESYYSEGAQSVMVDEMPAPSPIYYPQTSEPAEPFYYPEGAQLYFSGSTFQSDGGGGGGGQPSMSDWDPACKVYIGGLRDHANKYDIEDAFSRYGTVRNVWVARKPPGFAFVEMDDSRDAEDAVRGLDGERICGARVKVEMSNGARGGKIL